MKVVIALTDRQPPVGTVSVEGARPIEFSGWLGLLNVLGAVVDQKATFDVVGSVRRPPDRMSMPEEQRK